MRKRNIKMGKLEGKLSKDTGGDDADGLRDGEGLGTALLWPPLSHSHLRFRRLRRRQPSQAALRHRYFLLLSDSMCCFLKFQMIASAFASFCFSQLGLRFNYSK
ncbi:hypothetical protein SLA2020_343760 [Shorea laevis]